MNLDNSETYSSIAIVICYYGEFPWYFKLFLKSCAYNPTVDFLIITDIEYADEIPVNVFFIQFSWDMLLQTIDEKLDLKTDIREPYKLCDFKPAYGLIFSDILKEYDFWGHGDIDVVFGDIRKFITEETLKEFELINVRHDVISGYFLLFKNSTKMNELFRHSKDYVKAFTWSKHVCFDETNTYHAEFKSGIHFSQIKSEIESMNHIVLRLQEEGRLKLYMDLHVLDGLPGRLRWHKGILSYDGNVEILLYHMDMLKREFMPVDIPNVLEEFTISTSNFYFEPINYI